VPAGKYVKLLSPRLRPEIHEESGSKIYLWKAAQLEASQKTEKPKTKPQTDSAVPSVQLTTFKSWEEVGDWYRSLQKERVAVTPAIQAKADELTKGLQTNSEKERAIYNFVSTKFRYISLSFGVGRYQPHTGEEVLANQYGDCKDKHTLMAALLKAVGIDAWPALIGTERKLDEDFPSPAQFNHVITVVPGEKERLWLDSTPEVAPFGLLTTVLRDRKALVIPAGSAPFLATTPADPAFATLQLFSLEAAIDADGALAGHAEFSTRGDLELILRVLFHQIPPSKWSDIVEGLAQDSGFSGKTSKVDVDNPSALEKPFQYSYDYSQPKFSDWSNRRISPPLPPLLTAPGDDEEAPSEPFFLGAPGEMVYRATIRLPEKYSAELPPPVSAKADFAEYSGTYSLSNGVLKVERRLVLKKVKIPVDDWAEYRKFAKTVAGDHDGFIQLRAGAMTGVEAVPNNAEAEKLVAQAMEAGQRRDENALRDYLARAERLNPKQRNLWAAYGMLYFSHHELQKGVEAVEKEIQLHPDNIYAYRLLGFAQINTGQREEAISTFRGLLKQAPDDVEASSNLARLLSATKRYGEIPDLLQPLIAKGDNEPLQGMLAEALLRVGRKEEGIAAIQKYVQSGDGMVLNNAAFYLADTNTDLPLARNYAEKAVAKIESELAKVSLSSLSDGDLRFVSSLASRWDTLGWIHFREGDIQKAELYVDASWRLAQRGIVGDHLGQIYARQGKQKAAIHAWQLAIGTDNTLEDTKERLRKAGVSADPERPSLKRGIRASAFVSASEELGKLRLTDIPALPKQEGSAEFFVLFAGGKVEDVQFVSGSESLKGAGSALASAKYDIRIPDAGPEKIPRRGVLSCSTYTSPSCQFVMFLPSTTRK
jgi:tetratricopeptide (TPR) repeat protein